MYDLVSASEPAGDVLAIVGTSPTGTIKFWPPSASAFYHVDRNDAIGRNVAELLEWDLLPPDGDGSGVHHLGDAWVRNHRTAAPAEHSLLRTTVSLSIGPDGAEEALYCSAPAGNGIEPDNADQPAFVGQRFELAARCSNQMVIECVSAAVAPAFGLNARDLIGTRAVDRVHPDDQSIWENAWAEALSRPDRPIPAEVRGRTSDGDWRVFATEIVNRLPDRSVSAVVLNSRDLTDQRAAESSARAAELTLHSVLESMGRGIWVIDPSGATVFANTPMSHLLGLDPGQMSKSSIHDLWDRALSSVPEQRQSGRRSEYELPVTRPDGRTRWLRFQAVPRHNTAGEYIGSLLVCSDVTERRGDHRNGFDRDAEDYAGPAHGDDYSALEASDVRIVSRSDLTAALAADGLTPREFDIVDRLIHGDRVPVIATSLFVSQSTIRNQLAAVFRKVGVHSQQELIAYIRRARRKQS